MKKLLKKFLPPKPYYFLKRKLNRQFDERYLIYDFLDFKNGLMLDVGSMDGSSFMPFLLKKWKVYAFEPDKANYKLIADYLNKWNLKAVLIDKAVSDKEEKKIFYTSNLSTGIPSLLKFNENQVPSHEVSTLRLKDFVKDNQIEKVDFLKIDIEGYDFMALKGFDFSHIKPRVIMCEFEDDKTKLLGYTTRDMATFLELQGYFIIYSIWDPIQTYGAQHTWRKMSIDSKDIKENDWGNILAFINKEEYEEFQKKHKI